MFALTIVVGKRQKTSSMVTFGDWGWRAKSYHPDVFCKKGALEYLANFLGKHLYKCLFLKEVSGCRPATLFQEAHAKYFFCEMFKTLQNCFFIVHLRVTASDLIEYFETFDHELRFA